VLAKRYQNIHFIVWVSIQVQLILLCGNILWTCQYFKLDFKKKVFVIALLFVICVYSLNVLVVSYLLIITYDCVCVCV